jgi:hypothetical protein
MEQTVLTLRNDQCSGPWYVLGPVREITPCVLVTFFHELFYSHLCPTQPIVVPNSLDCGGHFYLQPFSRPRSYIWSPSHLPVNLSIQPQTSHTLHKHFSLPVLYGIFLRPLHTDDEGIMVLQVSGASYWVRQCHIPEENPQPHCYQITDHDNQSNITKRWAQRCVQGLYHCNSCYCSLKYHCTTHTQIKQTVPTTKRISTNIWQLTKRTATVIWER